MRICDWCGTLVVMLYCYAAGPEVCKGCFKEIYGKEPEEDLRQWDDYPRKVFDSGEFK